MIEVGRHCMKIAGRDAGKHCLIIDVLDKKTVMIDGETRRRKCNVSHIEPMARVAKLKKNASHDNVVKALNGLGIEVREKKAVPRKKKPSESSNSKKKK